MISPALKQRMIDTLGAGFGRLRRLRMFGARDNRTADGEDVASFDPPSGRTGDPSIAEMLCDPIVRAAMAADGVDPDTLEGELRAMGRLIAGMSHRRPQPRPGVIGPSFDHIVGTGE
jgi:hypothetical protein